MPNKTQPPPETLDPEDEAKLQELLSKKYPRVYGRPSKLSQELIDQTEKVLSVGVHMETAAAFVGVSRNMFNLWLRTARRILHDLEKGKRLQASLDENEILLVDFLGVIERSVATVVIRKAARIEKAGSGDETTGRNPVWQADAWWLERTHPQHYGFKREAEAGEGQGVGFRQVSIQPQQPRKQIPESTNGNGSGPVIETEGHEVN